MRIIRRYVLLRFSQSLLLSAAGFVIVFIVVDLSNSISAYLDRGASATAIVSYCAWSVPYFLFLSVPMAMLLGSLFCIGGLARTNELSAMKAAGISLYRILFPIQVFALIVSTGVWVASAEVVPRANRARAALKSTGALARQHRVQLVLRDTDGQVVTLGEYRVDKNRGKRVTLDQYSEGILVSKIRADELVWENGDWVFIKGERRIFDQTNERVIAFDSTSVARLTLLPEDFSRELRPIDQLDTRDLRALVKRKQINGLADAKDRVELMLRSAFSFAGLVMVLFGLPLSSYTRRASRPLQVAICLLVSFVFYGVLQATRAMGWNGLLNPTLAAWGPNCLFLLVGLGLLKRSQT